MTRYSNAKKKREFDLSGISTNHVMPEDIPVLIRKTAEELAGAFFHEDFVIDEMGQAKARSPLFRARWRSEKVYTRLNWASFVPLARTILSDMLTRDDVSLTQKEAIYEAFLKQGENRAMMDFSEALAPGSVH